MSIDLTLCPQRFGRRYGNNDWHLAYTRLDVTRDYDLFGAVKRVATLPLPKDVKFQWYGDGGVEARTEDQYGDPLRYAMAADLAGAALPADCSDWNRGVWAFLAALPHDAPVVLWWH